MRKLLMLLLFQLIEMNGKLVGKKPLYVAVAQRKEERRAQLQVMIFLYLNFQSYARVWMCQLILLFGCKHQK